MRCDHHTLYASQYHSKVIAVVRFRWCASLCRFRSFNRMRRHCWKYGDKGRWRKCSWKLNDSKLYTEKDWKRVISNSGQSVYKNFLMKISSLYAFIRITCNITASIRWNSLSFTYSGICFNYNADSTFNSFQLRENSFQWPEKAGYASHISIHFALWELTWWALANF